MLLQDQKAHELAIDTAHAVSPAAATSAGKSNKAAKRQRMANGIGVGGAVTLDTSSCLAEILVMGNGLVEDVFVKQGSVT